MSAGPAPRLRCRQPSACPAPASPAYRRSGLPDWIVQHHQHGGVAAGQRQAMASNWCWYLRSSAEVGSSSSSSRACCGSSGAPDLGQHPGELHPLTLPPERLGQRRFARWSTPAWVMAARTISSRWLAGSLWGSRPMATTSSHGRGSSRRSFAAAHRPGGPERRPTPCGSGRTGGSPLHVPARRSGTWSSELCPPLGPSRGGQAAGMQVEIQAVQDKSVCRD